MEDAKILPFHTYLWKVASRCNINCSYCYVYNSVDDKWRDQPRLMSEAVARRTALRMVEHLGAHGETQASVIFHGGEPMMGGVRHLEMLVRVIREVFDGAGVAVTLGMQTNLLLLTEKMAAFLRANRISIGVSLDGPPEVNDRYRVDKRGRPTSAALEGKLALLQRPEYRAIFGGFLCVIDPETDAEAVTDYLLSHDPPGIDYLFPLDNHDRLPAGKAGGLEAAPYGDWLVRAYDRWLARPNGTRIRVFQSVVNMMFGAPSLVEALGLNAVDLIVIESNGAIEAVDSLKTTFNGATQLGFHVERDAFDVVAGHFAVQSRQAGAASLAAACRDCRIVGICGGGYLPHRFGAGRGFDNPSVYCADLQVMIGHIQGSVSGALGPVAARATRRARRNGFASAAGMAASHAPIVDLARRTIGETGAASVLDLGCGDGMLLQAVVAQTSAAPFGLEIDARKARYAGRLLARHGGAARSGNIYAEDWPWPERVFDLAILPMSALVDAPPELAGRLRARLAARATRVIGYAYDDDRDRLVGVAEIAARAGLRLAGPAEGGMAALVEAV